MARDSRKIGKKVTNQKETTKRTREDKLAKALKKNIKLRKEKKN